jgi:hypothetical protein
LEDVCEETVALFRKFEPVSVTPLPIEPVVVDEPVITSTGSAGVIENRKVVAAGPVSRILLESTFQPIAKTRVSP